MSFESLVALQVRFARISSLVSFLPFNHTLSSLIRSDCDVDSWYSECSAETKSLIEE